MSMTDCVLNEFCSEQRAAKHSTARTQDSIGWMAISKIVVYNTEYQLRSSQMLNSLLPPLIRMHTNYLLYSNSTE